MIQQVRLSLHRTDRAGQGIFHCGSVFIIVSLNILFHIRMGQSLEAGLLFGRRSSDNLPYLKGVPLKKVTSLQIQLILGNLSGQSKSLNDKAIQILRGIFNAAVDNNLIAKSPVPLRLRSGGIATKEKAALTVEQSRQLLNAVFGTWAYLFCLIALQTGMRRGEICGLMWSDIDFDAQIIHVRHNAIFTSAQTVVSSDLKTAAARRVQYPRRSWRCLQAKRMALRVLLCSTWTTAARFRKPASLICGIWCAAEQLIIPTI